MSRFNPSTMIPGVLAAVGVAVIVLWLRTGPAMSIVARVPDVARSQPGPGQPEAPPIGRLMRFGGAAADHASHTALPGAWPCFRGPQLDGICHDDTPLARHWPEAGPTQLWSVELGEGYAGPAVLGGRVYVLDYDRRASADALRCLSLADGKEIWRYSYPVVVKRNHGMSRTVPAVTDKYVVALGPKCHVDLPRPDQRRVATGCSTWCAQFGTTVPPWYAGQCPLIEGDRVILAPGGDALLMAVDSPAGKSLWKTPNPHGWTMTHSSIMPMEFAGRRMYVYCGSGGVAGVSADDGAILWETTDWKISIATVPSPVVLPGGKIFFSRRVQRGQPDRAAASRKGSGSCPGRCGASAPPSSAPRSTRRSCSTSSPVRRARQGQGAGVPGPGGPVSWASGAAAPLRPRART